MLVLSVLMILLGIVFLGIGGLFYNLHFVIFGAILLICGADINIEMKTKEIFVLYRKLKQELDELKEKNK